MHADEKVCFVRNDLCGNEPFPVGLIFLPGFAGPFCGKCDLTSRQPGLVFLLILLHSMLFHAVHGMCTIASIGRLKLSDVSNSQDC